MKRYVKSVSYEDIPEENKHGDCFKVAVDALLSHVEDYTLVHAVVNGQGPLEGIQYVHAFCIDETRDVVVDNTQPAGKQEWPVGLYWYIGKIQIYKEYSAAEALDEMKRTGTYGPWDKIFNNHF